MMSELDNRFSQELLHRAAGWFERLRGPNVAEVRSDFEAWVTKCPLNRLAYKRVGEEFAMSRFLAAERRNRSD